MRRWNLRALPATVALGAVVLATLPVAPISAQSDPALPRRAVLPTEIPSPHMPSPPSVAAGYRAPDVEPSDPGIVGVTRNPFVGISLQDAIGMALVKNNNLAVSASNVRIARYRIVQAKANFDVHLQVEPSSSFYVQPPENIFFAGPGVQTAGYTCNPAGLGTPYPCSTTGPGNIIQHQYSFQSGVNGQGINGTQYSASISQIRTYNNVIINSFNPYYQAILNLSVTQPLLKNGGMNAAKHQLKLAVIDADSSTAQALVDTSSTLAQVEDAYWDLVAAWRNVAIQEEALKEAIEQQRLAVRTAARGAVAPITAVEAQTQVANFQSQLYTALQSVAQLQTQLKNLIVAQPSDPIWSANLVPSAPVQELPNAGDLAAILALAERTRPEVRQVGDQRRVADLDLAYAKNQALPQADLVVQYLSNGFAGRLQAQPNFETQACNFLPTGACPTPPPQTQGNMTQAFHNMWTSAYPEFNIAVVFNIPLENNTARGLKQTALQEEDQATIARQALDQRFEEEARNALQAYQSALSRLESASQARAAAESVYASELRRYRNHASTTFLVLQRQVELEQARGQELQAQTDLNKAVVELQRVEGTILTDNGVTVQRLGAQALATRAP